MVVFINIMRAGFQKQNYLLLKEIRWRRIIFSGFALIVTITTTTEIIKYHYVQEHPKKKLSLIKETTT